MDAESEQLFLSSWTRNSYISPCYKTWTQMGSTKQTGTLPGEGSHGTSSAMGVAILTKTETGCSGHPESCPHLPASGSNHFGASKKSESDPPTWFFFYLEKKCTEQKIMIHLTTPVRPGDSAMTEKHAMSFYMELSAAQPAYPEAIQHLHESLPKLPTSEVD